MPHILITDDHPMILSGLETILLAYNPTLHIYQATHIEAAKAHIRRNPSINLMLLDRTLPGTDSLQHLAEFWEISPRLRIAIMSAVESRQSISEAMEAGVAGFIPKSLPPETVIIAIQRLLAGQTYIPRELLDNPYTQYAKTNAALPIRHTEILSLAANGQTNKQIANTLQLTEGTVKQHFNAILKTLCADNRTHAIQIARVRGILC
ncbi:MAG: response regulator transcription factor [Gammaproteobacteria bacterium]|nr:response regulator transcription factor [Gammaproteobacteria bacterium]MBU1722465.1 response regulator transcription factor [Gammaproteobacteria bacterium]MBU2006461.1 response regulator transcription factor [Gammaproteobacteria bacterium]